MYIKPQFIKGPADVPEQLLESDVLNKGMVSVINPSNIDKGALVLAKNARIRNDGTNRRPGKSLLLPLQPDSSEVRKIFQYNVDRFSSYLIRFSTTSVHYSYNGAAWVALTGTIPLASTSHLSLSVVLGKIIVANGANKIQVIDLSAGTISDIGNNAPIVKYVTGFSERVVGAVLGSSPDEQSVATLVWSGNRVITEYDPIVDVSAGSKPLVTSASNSVDPITGLFGLTTVMIIPRENSLWLATKQAIARDPFNPYSAVSNIGADVPKTIQLTKSGLIFYSQKYETVYRYVPGMDVPEDVGYRISDNLGSIFDPAKIISCYDKRQQEYHLGLIAADGSIKVWIFNEVTNGWAYDELDGVTSLDVIEVLGDYTAFEDLTGNFEDLTGAFDELSVTPTATCKVMSGVDNGDILVEDSEIDEDNEIEYETEIQSKNFIIPKLDWLFTRIRVDYKAIIDGSIIIEYSKDEGDSWTTAKTVSTDASIRKVQFVKMSKGIKSRMLMWRIRSSTGITNFLRYEIYVQPTGESQR